MDVGTLPLPLIVLTRGQGADVPLSPWPGSGHPGFIIIIVNNIE